MHTKALFTTGDVRKRGLIWDGHSLPYNPNLVAYARRMRKKMTLYEKKLWYDFLRTHKLKFYRQRPIDHFIADFYCSKCGLVIEIDGCQHYTTQSIANIIDDLDESFLPYSFDISAYESLKNEELREHIDRVGKVFYSK